MFINDNCVLYHWWLFSLVNQSWLSLCTSVFLQGMNPFSVREREGKKIKCRSHGNESVIILGKKYAGTANRFNYQMGFCLEILVLGTERSWLSSKAVRWVKSHKTSGMCTYMYTRVKWLLRFFSWTWKTCFTLRSRVKYTFSIIYVFFFLVVGIVGFFAVASGFFYLLFWILKRKKYLGKKF